MCTVEERKKHRYCYLDQCLLLGCVLLLCLLSALQYI